MDKIYVLKRRAADEFGDGPAQWEIVGWTEDPRDAGLWWRGATRAENRNCECVKKMTHNVK